MSGKNKNASKTMAPKGKSHKIIGNRYFNADKSMNKKTQHRPVKPARRVHKRPKQPDKEVDRYQSHLPEKPGYVHLNLKESEDTERVGRSKTLRLTQEDILKQSDLASASKRFELKLPKLGPYFINYSRSGRYLLLGGGRGHIASIDWMSKKLTCEFQLKETVRAVQYLHNETMFAVAQKK